ITGHPDAFIAQIKEHNKELGADIFTFTQALPNTTRLYEYHAETDNVAAISVSSYDQWWEQLPQVTRKNIRRGIKRGVVARVVDFNDELIKGIIDIHNDTPMRQGKPFAHYGKDFQVVKREYGTFAETSELIGAYFESELIGILKLVYAGPIASILQI